MRENISLFKRIQSNNNKQGHLHPSQFQVYSERPQQQDFRKYNSLQILQGNQQIPLYNSLNIKNRVDYIVQTLNNNLQTYQRLSSVKPVISHSMFSEKYAENKKLKLNLSQNKFASTFYPPELPKIKLRKKKVKKIKRLASVEKEALL